MSGSFVNRRIAGIVIQFTAACWYHLYAATNLQRICVETAGIIYMLQRICNEFAWRLRVGIIYMLPVTALI